MSKDTPPVAPVKCGCTRCSCRHQPHCRCHVYDALTALVLWDYARSIRLNREYKYIEL